LAGLYGSIVSLAQQIAGLGINSSGVRQIAESAGSADRLRLARTTSALGRSALVLGALGAMALALLSKQISEATFGNDGQAAAISPLSLAALFNVVSGGQVAKIQGLRHISDLARVNVTGALPGTLTAIPIVFFFREQGVAMSLAALAAAIVATST
jgi:antigen flippase